ncbi:uncharacterized protein DNG_00797 [Cephalotrichum gorgonifer]|uniref:Uncharacterized protein n=1 Tax=Cephalotrichum gorgonifer TaxID=2041049 RepID=A0AAE8MRN7_9PEZI|nr:uncharacterized protein DNG_00797 [Cephalotrichum gorgonifer]
MSLSDAGGTMTLPSPTHPHHANVLNVSSAVRSLRRSMSRSPSRFNLNSQSKLNFNSRPDSPNLSSGSASPQSPCRREVLQNPGISDTFDTVNAADIAEISVEARSECFFGLWQLGAFFIKSRRSRPRNQAYFCRAYQQPTSTPLLEQAIPT